MTWRGPALQRQQARNITGGSQIATSVRSARPPAAPQADLSPPIQAAAPSDPIAVDLTLRLAPTLTGATIAWEGEAIGSDTSSFDSPYQGADLDLIVRALDHLQHPSTSLTSADITRLEALGLPLDSGFLSKAAHRAVGEQLFLALTRDPAAARALGSARNAAAREGLPLSLSLHIDAVAVALAALPWELLWAEDEPTPLLLSRGLAGQPG